MMFQINRQSAFKFIKFEGGSEKTNYDRPYFVLSLFLLVWDIILALHAYTVYTNYGIENLSVISFFVLAITFLPFSLYLLVFTVITKLQLKEERYIIFGINQVYFGFFFFSVYLIISSYFDPTYYLVPHVVTSIVILICTKLTYTAFVNFLNMYKSSKSSMNPKLFWVIFATVTLTVPRVFFGISESLGWYLIVAGTIFCVAYFLCGALNFLKYYYVKKFDITLDEIDTFKSSKKVAQEK